MDVAERATSAPRRLGVAARLLQVVEGSYRPSANEVPLLVEAAELNKLRLAFLRAVKDVLPSELASEEERFEEYLENCIEVAEVLKGLGYAFYKFRRPVDHVSVDLDVLVNVGEIPKAVRRLAERRFKVVVSEPYTVTLRRGDFVVDLYTNPSFAWIVYMDGQRLLRDYSEEFELAGVEVSGISREAEVAVAVAHAVYKEHTVLLLDCLTAERWLSRRAVATAEELGAGTALEIVLGVCGMVRRGFAEAPHRIPPPLLLKAYAEKVAVDRAFRATTINVPRYALRRRDFGRALLWRLTRRSY